MKTWWERGIRLFLGKNDVYVVFQMTMIKWWIHTLHSLSASLTDWFNLFPTVKDLLFWWRLVGCSCPQSQSWWTLHCHSKMEAHLHGNQGCQQVLLNNNNSMAVKKTDGIKLGLTNGNMSVVFSAHSDRNIDHLIDCPVVRVQSGLKWNPSNFTLKTDTALWSKEEMKSLEK